MTPLTSSEMKLFADEMRAGLKLLGDGIRELQDAVARLKATAAEGCARPTGALVLGEIETEAAAGATFVERMRELGVELGQIDPDTVRGTFVERMRELGVELGQIDPDTVRGTFVDRMRELGVEVARLRE